MNIIKFLIYSKGWYIDKLITKHLDIMSYHYSDADTFGKVHSVILRDDSNDSLCDDSDSVILCDDSDKDSVILCDEGDSDIEDYGSLVDTSDYADESETPDYGSLVDTSDYADESETPEEPVMPPPFGELFVRIAEEEKLKELEELKEAPSPSVLECYKLKSLPTKKRRRHRSESWGVYYTAKGGSRRRAEHGLN